MEFQLIIPIFSACYPNGGKNSIGPEPRSASHPITHPEWHIRQKLSANRENQYAGAEQSTTLEYALESCELFGGRGRSEAKDAHRCYWHARPDIEMISSSTQLNGAKKERAQAALCAGEHPSSLPPSAQMLRGNYFYSSCQVVASLPPVNIFWERSALFVGLCSIEDAKWASSRIMRMRWSKIADQTNECCSKKKKMCKRSYLIYCWRF